MKSNQGTFFSFKLYPKLDYYIFIISFVSSSFALLFLTLLETFFTFLSELQILGRYGYTLNSLLSYLLFDTPYRMYRALPMAILLGTLLGLGQLSSNACNEITAIRAFGLSKIRISFGAMVSTLILSIMGFMVGEIVIPYTSTKAEIIKNSKRAITKKAFWAITDDKIVRIESAEGEKLKNIILYQINDGGIKQIIKSDYATLNGSTWFIPQAVSTTIEADSIEQKTQKFLKLPTVIDKNALVALSDNPQNMSIKNLYRFINYLDSNRLNSSEYKFNFWNKLLSPLTNLSMLLIAMPFIFVHSRQTNVGSALFLGIMIGLIVYLSSRILSNIILLYDVYPILGTLIPIILSGLLGLLFFKLKGN